MSRVTTADDHRDWAAENERFYVEIGGSASEWRQWAMNALFYTALHELQAFFIDCGLRPATHNQRKEILRKPANQRQTGQLLSRRYFRLESYSRMTRYDCRIPSDDQFARAEEALGEVRDEIRRLGRLQLVAPPAVSPA